MVETDYFVPGAPRLALLTDFHNGDPRPVLRSLRQRRPELICIAGDVVYDVFNNPASLFSVEGNILPLLSGCADVAPTFLSLGNHECILSRSDLAVLAETGVRVLDNEWTAWGGIHIGGLNSHEVVDLRAYQALHPGPLPDLRARERGAWKTIRQPDTGWMHPLPSGYKLLLCHHPEYFPLIPPSIDLILCGHAHGGQWRLFGHGVYAPGQGFWPRWTAGVQEGRMVISRGLRNTTWIPRICNPTEVVYLNGATR